MSRRPPARSRRSRLFERPVGCADVAQVALARPLVDNTGAIQGDQALGGPRLARVALTRGANDGDAALAPAHLSQGRRREPPEVIRGDIQAASLLPAERHWRFELVTS